MRKKTVAIVGTVGLPAKYGGFETLTEYLVKEKNIEFDFTIFCSSKTYPTKKYLYNGAKLRYIPLKANGVQSVPYDVISILNAITKSEILLILGVSGCIILPLVKLFSNKKIIVNIDGLEWKRDKWGKTAKRFLKFSEKVAVKNADIVIADNKVIQAHVQQSYNKKAKLIAYGADHSKKELLKKTTLAEYPFLNKEYAFKVCRIEPENNIKLILKAFAQFKNLNLVIVGNWNVGDYSRGLKNEYSKFENIFLLDPIYEQKKLNELRSNCYMYVHGHSAGGTNPSLVEAMYLELPVLAFGVDYNRETTKNKAIYFDNKESLVNALRTLDSKSLSAVGREMAIIAKEEYTWKKIADQYAKIF